MIAAGGDINIPHGRERESPLAGVVRKCGLEEMERSAASDSLKRLIGLKADLLSKDHIGRNIT